MLTRALKILGAAAAGQAPVWNGTQAQWQPVVQSVGLSLPSIFSVAGSPVTGSGTLSASLASQTQNTVLAAPNGTNGTPAFRALATADLAGTTAAMLGQSNNFGATINSASSPNYGINVNTEITGASGTGYGLQITPYIAQSGTAACTDLLVNRTESSLGSGSQYLAAFQVGGVNKAYIDRTGLLFANSAAIAGAITNYGSAAGIQMQSRSGSGTMFTLYNPTGADLRAYNGSTDVGILTSAGALTVNSGITSSGQNKVTTSGNSTAPFSLVDSQSGGATYIIDNGYPAAGVFGIRDTTTRLCVKSGQIGIGTTSPQAVLHSTGSTILGAANAAVASANLGNSQVNIWVNESSNVLTFQVKYSSGTVKSGTIALA